LIDRGYNKLVLKQTLAIS